jgi:hypothetical protein
MITLRERRSEKIDLAEFRLRGSQGVGLIVLAAWDSNAGNKQRCRRGAEMLPLRTRRTDVES